MLTRRGVQHAPSTTSLIVQVLLLFALTRQMMWLKLWRLLARVLLLAEGPTHLEQLLRSSIAVRSRVALHLRVIVKILLAIVRGHYISLHLLDLGMLVESVCDVFTAARAGLDLAACQFLGLLVDLGLELMAGVVLALVRQGALATIRFEQEDILLRQSNGIVKTSNCVNKLLCVQCLT